MGFGSSVALPLFLCCLFVLSPGCIADLSAPPVTPAIVPATVTSTPEGPGETLPVAGMALQPDDLPDGYHLKDRTVASYSGISQVFRDLGWQQGYRVSFYRQGADWSDATAIVQEIDLYPPDTIKTAYSLNKENLLPAEDSMTDYQVPFPQIGDRSIAWREVRSFDTLSLVTYTVIFTKKNVYETISMTGTSTDYEVLRDLAGKAEAKIR